MSDIERILSKLAHADWTVTIQPVSVGSHFRIVALADNDRLVTLRTRVHWSIGDSLRELETLCDEQKTSP